MSLAKLRFWDYELNPQGFELCRAGHRIRLERKPMELLILLVEKRGDLVSREEIIDKIWGKNFFFDAENGINNAVRASVHIVAARALEEKQRPSEALEEYRIYLEEDANGRDAARAREAIARLNGTSPS
jgi:DNA-binding winged helix-turn-helix (wHTH) protein